MTREERAAVMAVVERLPATVARLERRPRRRSSRSTSSRSAVVASLSSSGGGRWWVGPREVRPELEEVAATGALRLGLRAVAVRPRRAAVRLGLHVGPSRGDLRGRLLVDLDRPLAHARHGPRPRAGLRPRVAPPGRGGLPGARRLEANSRRCTMPARSRRRGRPTSRRTVARTPSTTRPARRPDLGALVRDWMTGRLRPAGEAGSPSAPIGLTAERWALRSR